MLKKEDADAFARKVSNAVERVALDYSKGELVHENPFSGELSGRIKEALHEFETPNLIWQTENSSGDKISARFKSRQLTYQGVDSEESFFGADLIFCLDVESQGQKIQKGFLVQSKRL